MSEHVRYEELIAAYVLDALDESERRAAEVDLLDHIAACTSCSGIYRDLREVSGDLALAAEPVPVPAGMEERLLAAARDEPPLQKNQAPRAPWWGRLSVAAAILAIGVLGGMFVQSAGGDRDTRLAVSIMSDPSSESATLVGAGRGTGLVFVSPDGNGVLIARELRNPPKGHVLKLWLMHDGTPVPASAFTPADDIVTLQVAPGDYDAAAITIERKPDVRAPTRAPIYSGALST